MNSIYATGNFFGWLTVIFFAATILNYCIKFVNKHWGKKIKASPALAAILSFAMKIFVKRHRIWGFLAFFSLILHFIIQFLRFGISISGLVACILLILEVLLGFYAYRKKLPRKGAWFLVHRTIAVLLVVGVIIHIQLPFGLPQSNSLPPKTSSSTQSTASNASSTSQGTDSTQAASTQAASTETVFTLDELKSYNGKNGQPAYVAYKGTVYDVSNVPQWKNGSHNGVSAGTDVTSQMSKSPHGDGVLADVPVVGTLKN